MEDRRNTMTPYLYFYELEKEMELFSLEHRGVPYWQLVRVVFLEEILMQRFHVSCQSVKRNILQEILGAWKERQRMKKVMRSPVSADIVRLRQTVYSSATTKDPRYDYLQFDETVKLMDLYAVAEYSNLPKHVEYSVGPAEWNVVLWKVKRKLFGPGALPVQQKNLLEAFFLKINQHFGTDFQYSTVLATIQYTVHSHIYYKSFMKEFFRKASAKVLLMDLHYGDKQFAATAAAKELGMKVVELQHGQINQHKSFWYEDLDETGKILPDYFFVYGQWWKEQIKLPPFVQVEPLGSPYVEQQLRTYPAKQQRARKTITFFSNILSGYDLIELIERNYDVLRELDYRILFKLHPEEVAKGWKEAYPYLVNHPEIEVVEQESVYKLFAESDIVIGIISTVFFEALAYDHLKIALMTHVDCSEMRPLLVSGAAAGVAGDEDFRRLLNFTDVSQGGDSLDKTVYWSKNAHRNTVDFIMNLLHP